MSGVVAIGDRRELDGLVLAGVQVVPAASPESCVAAWKAVGPEVGMVILSAAAAAAIGTMRHERPGVLTVVTP